MDEKQIKNGHETGHAEEVYACTPLATGGVEPIFSHLTRRYLALIDSNSLDSFNRKFRWWRSRIIYDKSLMSRGGRRAL
jgi:hypothetical protein